MLPLNTILNYVSTLKLNGICMKIIQFIMNHLDSQRDRISGSDVDVCFSGNIAVTKLSI